MTKLEISRVAFLIYFMMGRLRNKMRSICSEFFWKRCGRLLRRLSECHVHSLWLWFLHSSSLQSVAMQSDARSDGTIRTVETSFLWSAFVCRRHSVMSVGTFRTVHRLSNQLERHMCFLSLSPGCPWFGILCVPETRARSAKPPS